MTIDRAIISKAVKEYSSKKSDILNIEIKDVVFVDNEPFEAADMYGNRYVKGTGGWIDIWVDISEKTPYGRHPIFSSANDKSSQYLRIFYSDYLTEVREKKLSKMDLTLFDRVKNRIDEYLEFDSHDIFIDDYRLIRIFGGAVRDSICGDQINDIDVLCGSKSIGFLERLLTTNGYVYMESLAPKDLASVYSDIRVISEPHTWIKGSKVVQVIRPSGMGNDITSDIYRAGFIDLIANVDISCCGLSYDSRGLYEDFPNAIIHAQSKVFSVNKRAKMYSSKRIHHRIGKFEDRGWKEIENNTHVNRDLKIEEIFN